MLIDRRAVADFLDRELDSYLWMKGLRKEAILRELRSLRVPPAFKTDPWLHQLVCFWIGICRPRFLFLLDMGLGKSKIISDLATQVQREKKLEGALITVPRLINVDSWCDDLAKHSNLEPWRIDQHDIEEKRERLLHPKGDVTIIDYQGLTLALSKKGKVRKGLKWVKGLVPDQDAIEKVCREYNFFAPDEIHKLANPGSLWHDICDRISERAEYVYGTTGTPFGKDPSSLWGQFHIVDRGEALGDNQGIYLSSYFLTKTHPFKGTIFRFDDRLDGKLHDTLQHSSIRYTEDEVPETELPKRVLREHKVDLTEEQREHYLHAVEGLLNANGSFRELEAPWLRMRQITSGYLAWKDESGDHLRYFKENPKLEDLVATLEAAGGKKMVIAYVYTATGRMIVEKLKELGVGHEWLWGGTKSPSAARRRFMDDPKCQVFVMNDEAGGTGNDGLQTVCNLMYLYETPSDPKARLQVIKRVHRPGLDRRAFIYDVVARSTVDRGILDGIAEGIDLQQRVCNGKVRYKNLFLS